VKALRRELRKLRRENEALASTAATSEDESGLGIMRM
jgi:hypothetical protein